jgi:hypothetical protein
MHQGAFVHLHTCFSVLWFTGLWKALWYFYVGKLLFYSKKVLAYHVPTPTSMYCSQCLGGVCKHIRWPNYPSAVSFDAPLCPFSYEVARVDALWSVSCWCSFFFSSFPPLLEKVHFCPFFFRFVNFSPFVCYCFVVLGHIIKILVFFNLVLEL